MEKVRRNALLGLANLLVVTALLLFVPAGTVRFAEGWVFLFLFVGTSFAITLYLAKYDPKLLERRTQAPFAEKELVQKVIQLLAGLFFAAVVVVPALDHRYAWSHVPLAGIVAGDVLVMLGFLIVFLVFRENSFTSAIIELAPEQRVIDTGPYAVVRHPMYTGGIVLMAGVPLALGSLVGLLTLVPFVAIVVVRLLNEEKFLLRRLEGYGVYRTRTRYRLIPYVW